MIVKMNKITLLCLQQDRDVTLEQLRAAGVLHITPYEPPQSDDYQSMTMERDRTTQALNALRLYAGHEAAETPAAAAAAEGGDVVERVNGLLARRHELQERHRHLEHEKSMTEPFGSLDPATVSALREKGVFVKLYFFEQGAEPSLPEESRLFTLRREKRGRIVAVISMTDDELDIPELPLPQRTLADLLGNIDAVTGELVKIEDSLRECSGSIDAVLAHEATLERNAEYLEAKEGMGQSEQISYIRGYCPADAVPGLRERGKEQGWGLVIEDPTDEDDVPTLIRYPALVRIIRPVFGFLGIVPGYRETDVSSAFLVFLSIFFAMIVGDTGYGLLFLILIPYFRKKKFPDAPSEPFTLLYTFTGCTMAWGMLTGNYFGIEFTLLPRFLQSLRVDWLVEQNNSMTFSLVLGCIHLSLAHVWNAIRYGIDPRTLSQLGWIAVVWSLFLVAQTLLLEATMPSWFTFMLVGGLVAIPLGMSLGRKWLDLGLLPLDLVSCFGDIMSYLRLFALGIASVKVAEAFNGMAGDAGAALIGGATAGVALWIRVIPAALFMGVILLFGHALNLVLCAMSVLVHGVRLNALEFSLHMGQEWSGFEYDPFRCRGTGVSSVEWPRNEFGMQARVAGEAEA